MEKGFAFTDRQVHLCLKKHNGNGDLASGLIPMPKTCDTNFLKECWTVWFNLSKILKKNLRRKCQRIASSSKNEMLLFIFYEDKFSLIIEPWVAGMLQLPAKIEIETKNPWEFFGHIMINYVL